MDDLEDLIGELPRAPAKRGLTQFELDFCNLFVLEGLSGNACYRRLTGSTANHNVVAVAVRQIRKRPIVAARIAELRATLNEKAMLSKVDVLNELAKIAMFDIRNLYDDDGELIPLHELDDATAACITGIEAQRLNTPTTEDPTKTTLLTAKVKLADKRAALVDIGKALGMFTDKVEHSGPNGAPLVPEYSQTDIARRVAFLLTSGLRATEAEQQK